jgi:alcohol dehydrogenase class IV
MGFSFSLARIPEIEFGAGKINKAALLTKKIGRQIIVVTGVKSLENSGTWQMLEEQLKAEKISFERIRLSGEPNPDFINQVTKQFYKKNIDAILAIGGGSVLDAGKAISAMLPLGDDVNDYLEGIGSKEHPGFKIPFIAAPTTAGTGSETTKNAVISQVGDDGFKKSLRHNNFVPDIAIIDPELTINLPFHITAACGLDSFTKLLESFVSLNASPMTDALALSGLERVAHALLKVTQENPSDIEARTEMAYASMLSGITLANAGLGVVHGFASSIGGLFNIPHGVVCGTLMGSCSKANIKTLIESGSNNEALNKYAQVGRIFDPNKNTNRNESAMALASIIESWTEILKIPKLRKYGITENHFDKIIRFTGQKYNPVKLSEKQLYDILKSRL